MTLIIAPVGILSAATWFLGEMIVFVVYPIVMVPVAALILMTNERLTPRPAFAQRESAPRDASRGRGAANVTTATRRTALIAFVVGVVAAYGLVRSGSQFAAGTLLIALPQLIHRVAALSGPSPYASFGGDRLSSRERRVLRASGYLIIVMAITEVVVNLLG